MLNVPPGATVNAPSKSPHDQLKTALEETIKEPLIVAPEIFITAPGTSVPLMVPLEYVALPTTKPLPVQLPMLNAPLNVVTVPPSLSKFQLIVLVPVPPIFSSVPVLTKRLLVLV